ncbi:MAG: glycosyltransferase family 2 protein [Methanocellales archaeon]|nr:glycosyltransferase family 2 protein [Methanocellales archaeon]
MSLLLLLPTLNEEEALRALADEIPAGFDVLIVDGHSTDKTKDVALKYNWKFITQRYGKGKGCAIRTAMEEFLNTNYDHLGIIDADYSSDPMDVKLMLKVLEKNDFDVLLGSRDIIRQRELLGWFSVFINRFTSTVASWMYKYKLTDIQTGCWVFTRNAADKILPDLIANGFEIEYDLLYNIWKCGLRVGETPVGFRERIGESKFSTHHRFQQILHGLRYVYWSLKYLHEK